VQVAYWQINRILIHFLFIAVKSRKLVYANDAILIGNKHTIKNITILLGVAG
jgi:hypothetical protein